MGKKRKHHDRDTDRILKKLRRLEKVIFNRRRHRSSSRSDHEAYYSSNNEAFYESVSPQPSPLPQPAISDDEPEVRLETETKTVDNNQQPGTSSKDIEDDVIIEEVSHLDDEILTLLGDAPKEHSPIGPDVHNDIALRLQDILLNGLKKEQKDIIIENYPIPGNCPLFSAPLLNPEVKAATSDMLQKKDASLAARQRQVGTALSALTKSMDILINDKSSSSQEVLRHVSSACRLLCDSHFIDTKLRRNFIVSTLNHKMKDTLKETKRDKNLFGEDLAEKLKASKAITKSGQDLKFNKPKTVANKNSDYGTGTQYNLNWKHPQPNRSSPSRKPAHRSAGAPSMFHYGSRSRAEADSKRRPTSSRARGSARYSYKRRR